MGRSKIALADLLIVSCEKAEYDNMQYGVRLGLLDGYDAESKFGPTPHLGKRTQQRQAARKGQLAGLGSPRNPFLSKSKSMTTSPNLHLGSTCVLSRDMLGHHEPSFNSRRLHIPVVWTCS